MTQPSGQPEGYTTLGRIGAAVGIKGWVRLISFTDPADNILQYRHFILAPLPAGGAAATAPDRTERIEIDESRIQGKDFIGHIRGCDDRDLARQ